MEFPALLFKSPGPYKRYGGGTYKTVGVCSEDELQSKLSQGWFTTKDQAIDAAGDLADGVPVKKPRWAIKASIKRKPSQPFGWNKKPKVEEKVDTVDDAPPTRLELETKAKELGIKFDGRTSDRKLGILIQEKLE